jgi:hypothetical protein
VAYKSQPLLKLKGIDLDHHTISLKGETFPPLLPDPMVLLHLLYSPTISIVRIYLKSERLKVFHSFPMSGGDCFILSIPQAINIDIQRALCSDARIKLAYRAGSSISGVSKGRLALSNPLLI